MYSCMQTVTWSRGVKKKGAKKGAKSDMTYCLKVICCRVIKQTKNKQKNKKLKILLANQNYKQCFSTNRATSWRIIYLKHLNWRNKQPPLSLDKTRTYWCFYYFTFNLRTANVCSRPVQSLGRKCSPGSNRSRDIWENIIRSCLVIQWEATTLQVAISL